MNSLTKEARLKLARISLQGLSVGDAFGETFFGSPEVVDELIRTRTLRPAPWPVTDDTVMALSIVDVLAQRGCIDCDLLAAYFASRYRQDPSRGYGGTAHDLLGALSRGESWQTVSRSVFNGSGSMGNGGAMRSAPIGAYFFDDLSRVAEEAKRSAQVTHGHLEGQAGAIAVSIAAAWVAAGGLEPPELFDTVLTYTPDSETRNEIAKASRLPSSYDVRTVVAALGNGSRVISQDTVPFALWCAAHRLDSFQNALWFTVSGLGDRDTTCAIVGGIVALRAGAEIPRVWLEAREPLSKLPRVG
jgi:ADP-ribosylglycohydrolase